MQNMSDEQAYREGVKLAVAHYQIREQQKKAAEYPMAFSPPPPVAMPPLPDPMIVDSDKGHLASSIIHARAGNKKLQRMALTGRS